MSEKSVLIVDADNASRNYLTLMVKEQRYTAMGVGSGKEGLIVIWRDRPDLIIFDPPLQDTSPEGFLLKLRRDLRSANIPVLALSSNPDSGMKDACLQAGCNENMVKSGEMVAAFSPRPEAAGFKLSADVFGGNVAEMLGRGQRR